MADAAGGRTPEDVRRVLAERISAGHLRPGQRLGAERALAADLGVSRATLRQALAVLADSGVVRRVPGRGGGTFVSQDKIERDTSRVVGRTRPAAQPGRRGRDPGDQRRAVRGRGAGRPGARHPARRPRHRPGPDPARGRQPYLRGARLLPADRFPGLLELPLGGSVYELLDEHFGTRPAPAAGAAAAAGAARGR